MKLYNEVMVCYDVEDNKVRTRLFGQLKDLGLRPIQKSVFWGHLNVAEERAVLRLFREELDKATDRAFLVRTPLAEAAERNSFGYSEGWVKKSKASMKSVMPRFNAQRMVMDYVQKYYAPARKQLLVMQGNNFARARELAAWRKKIAQKWPQVRLQRLDSPAQQITSGAVLPLRVAAALNGLEADDVLVECLVGTESESGEFVVKDKHVFSPAGRNDAGETLFNLDLKPRLPGLQYYEIRIYPFHAALAHRFEAGYMIRL